MGGKFYMTTVNRVDNRQQIRKIEKKEEQSEPTQVKSANIQSTNPSERAKDISRNQEIQEGKFKSRSDATVGDIAQANSMKEDGTVDPSEVKQNIKDIVGNNKQITQAALESGINLENPTEEDLQKLSNLDVKAGQEVNVPMKPDGALTPEESAEETKAEETPKAETPTPGNETPKGDEVATTGETPTTTGEAPVTTGESPANQEAQATQAPEAVANNQQGNDVISQVMALIQQAEQAQNPGTKRGLAQQAIGLINQLRTKEGLQNGQEQQQQQQNQLQQDPKVAQLVQNINLGAQIAPAQLKEIMDSGNKDSMTAVLDALEARANRAMNGNNTLLNALNMLGMQNQNLMNYNKPQNEAKQAA